jgi:predicted Zn-dependent protease
MKSYLRLAIGLYFGFFATIGFAQTRTIDLGSLFDAGKNLFKSQQVASISDEEEIAVGRDIAASTLGTYPLVKDNALQSRLNEIGMWVAAQSSRPDLPWRFAAVESNAINAFAVPGGIILVTRGTLKQVANEAELACVLGHEIGHVVRRHHISVMSKSLVVAAGANALNLSSTSADSAELRKQLIGEGKEIFSRGLDRSAEREADEDGVLLAARAGYDPATCLAFMQRLASLKTDISALEALYKTHPQAKDRVEDIQKAIGSLKGASAGEGARPPLSLSKPTR